MRPWWSFIHVCRCNRPEIPSDFYEFVDFLHRRNIILSQIFNKDSPFLVWPDLQVRLIGIQQVLKLLHVQLNKRYLDPKLYVFIEPSNGVKDLLDHPRDDSWVLSDGLADSSFHGMRFAWCSLPIGEDGAVKALNNAIDDRWGSIVVNLFLVGIDIKDLIEGKLQGLFLFVLNRDGLIV